MISHNILCNPVIMFMIGLLIAVIIAIFMALLYAINVIAQSQNETNETDIGENQSVSGRISGFGGDFGFGPRVVDNPAMVNSS
jgi:MFS superfamily sulfate permease-like transporter